MAEKKVKADVKAEKKEKRKKRFILISLRQSARFPAEACLQEPFLQEWKNSLEEQE